MTFDQYVANMKTIFASFPNEQVWLQGGLGPNRQMQKPKAGYCIVFRYDAETADIMSGRMAKIRAVLPPVVEYNVSNFHTTIGVYGKREMAEFIPNSAVLGFLDVSIDEGLGARSWSPQIELGQWLFNEEAILVSGYPNRELWELMQNIGRACRQNGCPLEMSRITHVTTARFTREVTRETFERLVLLIKAAPLMGAVAPSSIDLATWRCDGLKFELVTHSRHSL